MATEHVSGIVRILNVGHTVGIIDTVPVVAIQEERCFSTRIGESVGDLTLVDVWT